MTNVRRRFSIGWVFVSFLMIAGGFMIAGVSIFLTKVTGDWVVQGVFFLGAFAGGFFAGRASPGKTIAEPGLAGVLLSLTVFGLPLLVPGAFELGPFAGDVTVTALKMAFVTGLGGFVGGLLGERTSTGEPSQSGWRWWGIATLINLGMTYFLLGMFAVLLLRSTSDLGDGDMAAIGLAAFALGTLGSGFVAQAVAPRSMPWTCGAGALGLILFVVVVNAATGTADSQMFLGGAVVGAIATVIGALGAILGWALIGRRALAHPQAGGLPQARLEYRGGPMD